MLTDHEYVEKLRAAADVYKELRQMAGRVLESLTPDADRYRRMLTAHKSFQQAELMAVNLYVLIEAQGQAGLWTANQKPVRN